MNKKDMDKRELRIGNLIEIDQYPQNRMVVEIENGSDIDECILLNPKPVAITKDLLTKLGFRHEANSSPQRWIANDAPTFSYSFFYETISRHGTPIKKTKHVHLLQNIYADHTGKYLSLSIADKNALNQ